MNNSKKVWTYIRKTYLPDNTSLEEQKLLLRKWCESHGYEIVGETAILGNNEKSRKTIADILHQEPPVNGAEFLVTPSFSHFSRDTVQAFEILNEMRECGIGVIEIDNPVASDLQMIKELAEIIQQMEIELEDEKTNGDNAPQLSM